MSIRHWLPIGVVLLFSSACATTTTSATLKVKTEVLDSLRRYEHVYMLQAGDQIEVFVYRHPEFSRHTVIRPDGYIAMPLVGEVKAAGKAPRDLQVELVKRFEERIREPEVTVMVENAQEPVVYVVGEVGTPRAVPLRQAHTVAQALAQSGNATRTGSLSSVSVIRLNDQGYLQAITPETDGLSQPEAYMALQNIALVANDLILVPESYRALVMRSANDFNTVFAPYLQFRILHDVIQK